MVLPFDGGPPTRRFNIRVAGAFVLRWSSDGYALLYIDNQNI